MVTYTKKLVDAQTKYTLEAAAPNIVKAPDDYSTWLGALNVAAASAEATLVDHIRILESKLPKAVAVPGKKIKRIGEKANFVFALDSRIGDLINANLIGKFEY